MLTAMLGSRYRGRRKGVSIREGSVKQARLELGLSLADVAGSQLSRTAIHLIEHGRSRPSMQTLRLIARRTNKPIEYFIASGSPAVTTVTQPRILDLDRLTVLRDFDAVIATGLPLTARRWSRRDRALVAFYVGQAFCRLVRPDESLRHLRLARNAFEELDDEPMVVEALDWEAAALGLLEDPAALSLAIGALDRCRKLDPIPLATEARILGHIASMYVVRESWKSAISYYEQSAVVAGHIKDLLQMAKMHHGLGGAYKRLGDPAAARQHYDRALALYSLESDKSAVYRVENDLGDLYLQQGMLDAAEIHLKEALSGCDQLQIERRGRGFILVGLGELHLRKADYEKAREYLGQALESAEATGERIVQAEAHVLLGQIEERSGRHTLADDAFQRAIFILEELEMPDRLRSCHMQYAEILESRGDIRSAANHWRAAAEIGREATGGRDIALARTQRPAAGA
jgi:tetratricopeptide (TPR) repeat protein/DNA-binding XRE family transcriptional regulator